MPTKNYNKKAKKNVGWVTQLLCTEWSSQHSSKGKCVCVGGILCEQGKVIESKTVICRTTNRISTSKGDVILNRYQVGASQMGVSCEIT